MKNFKFKIFDNQRKNMRDKLTTFSPKGRVIISENVNEKKIILRDTSNLILYRGRNWLLQRAFNKQSVVARADWKDKYLCWFGLGSGGAVIGSPLSPVSPNLSDTALVSPLPGGASNRILDIGTQGFHQFDTSYPNITFDPDIEDETEDTKLVALIQVTIDADEYNGDEYQDLSEAGLFVCSYDIDNVPASPVLTDFDLFARVCFSTIRKDVNRQLTFAWYIYF